MRTRKGAQRATSLLVLLLQLVALQTVSISTVHSLSILPNGNSNKNSLTPNNSGNVRNNQHSSNGIQQQQQQITTLPPLMTTISQNNYLDSLQAKQQQQQQQQPAVDLEAHPSSSGAEDHEDQTVPLATINNHSRNNQPAARPPQYVDVAALVGRDLNRNLNSSGLLAAAVGTGPSSGSLSSTTLAGNANSGLTAKSRSGLPECATQQVCNAIFVRMNYTQKLCECSSNYNWKCSHNLDPQDGHTIELTRKFDKRIYTQIKTCEPLREVRACKSPTDWTLLALQSERSGKAHYVVVCKCPTWAQLEGPYTHNHPPYANIPGIRVYGMLCAHQTARSSAQTYATYNPALNIYPEFPWPEALNVLNTTNLLSTLDSH